MKRGAYHFINKPVLIDELDALVTPKQTLLYNLFNWPCS